MKPKRWGFLAGVAVALLAQGAMGQQPNAASGFEAIVIRDTPATTTNWRNEFVPGRMRFENRTLRDMIMFAYGLSAERQVVGAQGWMVSQHFDVTAKEEDELAKTLAAARREEWRRLTRELVRGVLEERFQLKVEQKKVVMPVLALVEAKGGSKVKATNPGDGRTFYGIVGPTGSLEARATTMAQLADRLTDYPDANGMVVVDRTGLEGKFDWKLRWAREAMGGTDANAEELPPLFIALQEQLGLRLVSQKAEVQAVVILNAKLPKAN